MSLLLRLLGFAVTSSAAIAVALALTVLLRKKRVRGVHTLPG